MRMNALKVAFLAIALLASVPAAAQVLGAPNSTATSMATQTADHVAVTGGTIDGATIGGTTPAPGTFTTLNATTYTNPTTFQAGTLYGGGTTSANASLKAGTVSSAVNEVVVSGGATGTAPTVAAGGSGADANVNLGLAGNGTGIVVLGQTICTISGATPQTCNGQRGIATTGTLSTAGATDASYVINNSSVTTSSLIACTDQGYSGTLVTNGYPVIMSCVPGSSTITVHITNTHATNALSGTVKIGFAVLN